MTFPGYSLVAPLKSDDPVLFRATRAIDGRPVLLKVPASPRPAPAILRRLEREYELSRELDSSRIVRALALERHGGSLALVLESGPTKTLASQLGSPMEIQQFFRIALGITGALIELHGHELLHKDIKPEHVLLDASGRVWLTGLGIASRLPREHQPIEPPEALAGTLAYMAPEQTGRMNRSIDSRSDLYALGVTFYQMLTGELPFTADDPMEWVHCHIARQSPAPSERVQSVPKVLSDLVLKLLAKTAEERYQTARGLAADLAQCLQQWQELGRIEPFPLGARDILDRLLIPEKLYGREAEILALLAAFERVVARGTPELMLVSGYSGIGKSSAVHELHKVLVPPRGLFASGKFDQFKRDIPYATLVQALQTLVRQILGKSEEEVAAWREAIQQAVSPNGQLIVSLIPEVELIIGKQTPVPELPPQESQNRFKMVLQRFLGVFAAREHPLALFLDDLQWLDAATLDLLEELASGSELRHLLLIGAYRDNEVDPAHPLMRIIEAIRKSGAGVREIVLAPLASGDVVSLVADTLHCERERALPLAQLVHEKTAGNPFFTIQFLTALAEEKLLAFDSDAGAWIWDLARIQAKGFTDNVVDLMLGKIRQLPLETRNLLPLAACIGFRFSLSNLGVIAEESEDVVLSGLQMALREGLILPLDEEYQFVHDRVQQAAYSLTPDDAKKALHLKIGKFLLKNAKEDGLEEKIFQIVNHLNQGRDLLGSEKEKLELAALNLKAGIKAKQSSAPSISGQYLQTGIDLLPVDLWSKQYSLALELFKHKAQANFLSGEFDAAKHGLKTLLENTAGKYDKADVYLIMMIQSAQLGEYQNCFDIGIESMGLFDYSLPDLGTLEKTERAMKASVTKFKDLLGDRRLSQLKDLPDIANKDRSYLIKILSHICDAAYIAVPSVFPHVIFEIVNISIEYGLNNFSAVGFCWLPVLLGTVLKDYHMGYESGRLSLALNERYGNAQLKSFTLFLSTVFTIHWKFHAKTAIQDYAEAFKAGVDNGENTYSGYAMVMIPKTSLAVGVKIDAVREENRRSIDFLSKSRSIFVEEERCFWELLNNLTNTHELKTDFDCSEFKEEECLEKWQNVSFGHGLGYYLSYKTQNLYLFGRFEEAYDIGQRHQAWTQFIATLYEETQFYFYHTLCAAAIYPKCNGEKKKQAWATIKENEGKFAAWAVVCPDNFKHKHLLIQAEIARLQDRKQEAIGLYNQALESALEFNYANNAAVINELAARFWLSEKHEDYARLHLVRAYKGYAQWQAWAVVKALEMRYPEWLGPEVSDSPLLNVSAPHPDATMLDLATVMKASHAISSEMEINLLLGEVMHIVIENAGAQSGFLLLERGDKWVVAAKGEINKTEVEIPQHTDIDERDDVVSLAVVRFVARTKERVALDDAASQGEFSGDPHIKIEKTKSLLCAPLLSRGKLVGILYLKNNLATHAFTPERVQLLELILSQAAISLENALVYEALRQSEQKLRAIFDQAFQFIGVLSIDGIVLQANQTALQFAGVSEDVVLGKLFWETPWWAHSAELQEKVRAAVREAAGGEFVRFEATHTASDGQVHYVDFSLKPVTDSEGRVVEIIPEGRDITERKRAEDALRLSSERLQLATRVANIGIWDWDVVSNELVWDDSMYQLYGIEKGGFGGAYDAWISTLHSEDKAYTDGEIQAALRGEREYAPEFRIVRPDGSIRYIKADSKTIHDRAGKPLRMIGTNIDITERKQAEEEIRRLNQELEHRVQQRTAQLERANKELEAFSYSVSHDLRAPLRSIDGFSAALLEDYADKLDEEGKDYMRIVRAASQRMSHLIDDLLKLSRLSRSEIHLAPVNLSELARAVADELQREEPARRVEFVIQPDVIAEADAGLMRAALENLLGNAWKFTGKRPSARIEFGQTTLGGNPAYFVRDNGAGFDSAYADKLFGAFQRLHDTSEFPGTGIGLATVQRIIHRHGGHVWAEGKIDHGATFSFSLPQPNQQGE
jgi:PAS domain S-box-containing protein